MWMESDVAKLPKEDYLITIFDGRLILVYQGNFTILDSPVILKNGAIITTDGLMKMPDGKSRKLLEGEYV
jgi:hypothetical protein